MVQEATRVILIGAVKRLDQDGNGFTYLQAKLIGDLLLVRSAFRQHAFERVGGGNGEEPPGR